MTQEQYSKKKKERPLRARAWDAREPDADAHVTTWAPAFQLPSRHGSNYYLL